MRGDAVRKVVVTLGYRRGWSDLLELPDASGQPTAGS